MESRSSVTDNWFLDNAHNPAQPCDEANEYYGAPAILMAAYNAELVLSARASNGEQVQSSTILAGVVGAGAACIGAPAANADQQHNERIERMRRWLKDWYNKDLPRPDRMPLWLGTLKGQEFEREFFKEYLAQVDEGIEQTAKCAAKAVHPRVA